MKTIGWALVLVAAGAVAGYSGWRGEAEPRGGVTAPELGPPVAPPEGPRGADSGAAADRAFRERAAGRLLVVEGVIRRLLPDDRDGSPHQRFIIVTEAGQSLLVAHNLDLAPRLDGLSVGERVRVYGEYEWNPQGGVMHWTYDDPRGVHPAGYVEWRGRRYQ